MILRPPFRALRRPVAGLGLAALLAAAAPSGFWTADAHAEPRWAQEPPLPFVEEVEEPFDEPLLDEDVLEEEARRAIERFLDLLGPMIERFGVMLDDLPAYHAPEILPNGDILIRRKRPEERRRPRTEDEGPIDL